MPTSSCSATATFIYCLIVDGTVRENLEFVPQLSTAAGILLGVVDIAVLIFFIHHVATSVRVESVIANITDDLRDVIEKLFPPNSASARPIRTKSNAHGRSRALLLGRSARGRRATSGTSTTRC